MSSEYNGSRLRRNPRKGMLFGVCAGLAEYFGFDLTITRVLVVIVAVFNLPMIVIAYLVLALLMPKVDPHDADPDSAGDGLNRHVRSEPHTVLSNVRYRFRDLDMRLQKLEKYVTSERFKLDSEFAKLKD